MKNIKILILLMLCSFGLSAQIINDNTDVNTSGNAVNQALSWDGTNWVNEDIANALTGYPVDSLMYANDFSANITGWSGFNGGLVAWDSGREAMRIINLTGDVSKAALLSSTYTQTEGN
jgi:hypothetical protein